MSDNIIHANCCPVCSYEWRSLYIPTKCPFCDIDLTAPPNITTTTYEPGERDAIDRYADLHASEFEANAKPPMSDFARFIFDTANATNAAIAASLRAGRGTL